MYAGHSWQVREGTAMDAIHGMHCNCGDPLTSLDPQNLSPRGTPFTTVIEKGSLSYPWNLSCKEFQSLSLLGPLASDLERLTINLRHHAKRTSPEGSGHTDQPSFRSFKVSHGKRSTQAGKGKTPYLDIYWKTQRQKRVWILPQGANSWMLIWQ